jgi:hypothetical protein
MKHGVLSHNLSLKLSHPPYSVAMKEIQDKRKDKVIPGTDKKLHDYANFYFDAHNPMLSKVRKYNNEICVLRISTEVLGLPTVIISDQNAASDWAGFYDVARGLSVLDKDKIFARYWTNPNDQIDEWKRSSAKCAEVLVPNKIDPKYILGAIVANQAALESLRKLESKLPIEIKGGIFF